MTKYAIYHKGNYIGDSVAVSPQKAINNMRFRKNMLYARMSEFRAEVI